MRPGQAHMWALPAIRNPECLQIRRTTLTWSKRTESKVADKSPGSGEEIIRAQGASAGTCPNVVARKYWFSKRRLSSIRAAHTPRHLFYWKQSRMVETGGYPSVDARFSVCPVRVSYLSDSHMLRQYHSFPRRKVSLLVIDLYISITLYF
jgi:hypothetical protein